ncbi:aldose 1-epimerase [Aureococcus anophagefferens]|uniref:Aldose 1-epimerase n=1 Tax=Aureococcus anophagefferens TaxID=44056 RepID=A0ABR1GC79_AURAN
MAAMTQQASYTLRHAVASSIVVTVRPLGATLSSVLAPDRNGALGEVTLGFDEGEGDAPYLDGRSAYFGCVAGRVANRTKGAAFELDGATYTLAANDGANHLHGGTVGFDKRRWTVVDASATALTLALRSGDGDEGYPGTLDARVTYSLPDPRTLRVAYAATTDKATPVNLTNHAYWNLNDGGASPVVDHELQVDASFYTPVGEGAIPTGEIRRAAGAMDLSAGRRLGDALYDTDGGAGYDHNYARPRAGESFPAATARDRVYTGNFLDGVAGRGGTRYGRHAGLCLETQLFPDALHNAHFPSAVLRPGSTYAHATEHVFSAAAARPAL